MNISTLILLILLALFSFKTFADTTESELHIAAHFGGVYAITDISAVVCNKITKDKHRDICTVTGMILGNAANVGYKASQGFPNDTNRAITSGLAGSVAAGLMLKINF